MSKRGPPTSSTFFVRRSIDPNLQPLNLGDSRRTVVHWASRWTEQRLAFLWEGKIYYTDCYREMYSSNVGLRSDSEDYIVSRFNTCTWGDIGDQRICYLAGCQANLPRSSLLLNVPTFIFQPGNQVWPLLLEQCSHIRPSPLW